MLSLVSRTWNPELLLGRYVLKDDQAVLTVDAERLARVQPFERLLRARALGLSQRDQQPLLQRLAGDVAGALLLGESSAIEFSRRERLPTPAALPNFAALPNAARVTSVAFATPLLKFSEVAGSEASAFMLDGLGRLLLLALLARLLELKALERLLRLRIRV